MRETHLRAIDLNLLPVLDSLLRCRNATRAGQEVGLSQPAMSRALGRLRELLDDPLLVRGPGGYLLSPRAEALRQPLAAMLSKVQDMLADPRFDPATEQRVLRLAMSDAQAELLLAPLVRRIGQEAPGVIVEWVPIGPGIVDRMREGTIDLAFALDSTPLPRGAMSEPFMADDLAVVMRRDHPSGGDWPIGHYATYPSVMITLMGDRASDLDAELAAMGISRKIAAIVPTFRAAVEIVAATDAVTTISRAYAARLANAMQLQLVVPPLRDTTMRLVVVWADHRANDRILIWLRRILSEVSDLTAAGSR